MADNTTTTAETSQPEPLSLKAFAASLYHAERADNYFKFLNNLSEEDLAAFLQGLLQQVGDAIDDGKTEALTRFVRRGQVAAYLPTQTVTPFRPDFPDSPFSPMRKPLRESTIALFSSGAIYRDDQEPYYLAELTYEQAIRDVRKAHERFPSLRVISAETPDERMHMDDVGLRRAAVMHVGHVAYDIRAATKDVNVIFPLTRFRELAHEGIIGALAERNYSYHGLTNIPRLMNESAPQWAHMLKDDGDQNGVAHISIDQCGIAQVGACHSGLEQEGMRQGGIAQVGPEQISPTQISPTQVSIAQVSAAQVDIAQIGVGQIND